MSSITGPLHTDFEKRLIELNLTYAQIELVKQAVEELVIGADEPKPRLENATHMTQGLEVKWRNHLRTEQRRAVHG